MNPSALLKRILGLGHSPTKIGLSKDLDANVAAVRAALHEPVDLYVRDMMLGRKPARRIAVIFLRSMADLNVVRESLTDALQARDQSRFKGLTPDGLVEHIRMTLPTVRGVVPALTLKGIVSALLEGRAAAFVHGSDRALTIGVLKTVARPYQQPSSEVTVLGPQIGFTESVEENVSLIRTRLRTPNLAVERLIVGRKSRTEVRLLYLRGIAPPEIVSEIRRRLNAIDTDVILDAGTIRNLIEERPFSPFIMERLTERPDTTVVEINHGLTAVLVDGSPFALLQPSQFFTVFEAAEDYYTNSWSASVLRLVRMLAYVLSTLATPIYIAVVTFHHELIPLPLLLNIAATQEGVPLPLALTAFLTEIVLDVVREAGVRLPQQFGPAVSIVGALVLGQSAIQAGFLPPGLVIVAMFATIASFAVPRSEKAIAYRLIRFPLLLAASTLGLPGLALTGLAVVYHLASLKTLGVPYFSLYTPGDVARLTRKVMVAPLSLQPNTRPLGHQDKVSRGPLPKPRDPKRSPQPGDNS